jgi:DHA1 family tetracycline resistance protein-like MFS transporter
MIAGIMGASFTTAVAYIADVSEPDKRPQNFGMIGAAFGLGFILGPMIGGFVSGYGTKAPFVTSAILTLINWLYGFFVLPESLKPENRRKFDWKRANAFGALMNIRRFPMLIGLVSALFLALVSSFSTQGTWNYYTKEKFNWSEQEIGWSLSFVGLMIALVQGGLTRILIPKLGTKKAIYLGFTFSILGALAYAFANQGWMMYAIMIPFSLGGLVGPSIQGIISSQVPPNEQGELQGSLTSLNSIASIIGPVLMTWLFHKFTAKNAPIYFPGVPFLTSFFLTSISFLTVAYTMKKFKIK